MLTIADIRQYALEVSTKPNTFQSRSPDDCNFWRQYWVRSRKIIDLTRRWLPLLQPTFDFIFNELAGDGFIYLDQDQAKICIACPTTLNNMITATGYDHSQSFFMIGDDVWDLYCINVPDIFHVEYFAVINPTITLEIRRYRFNQARNTFIRI